MRSGQKSVFSAVNSCTALSEHCQRQQKCELQAMSEAPTVEELDVLRGFAFFQDLEPSTQAKLPGVVKATLKRRGTVLFREGDLAERCFIVLSGQVSLSAVSSYGSPSASECSTSASSRKSSLCSTRSSSCSATPSGSHRGQADVLSRVATKLAVAASKGEVASDLDGVSLKAGRIFGDVALLHCVAHGFTASCAQDCELLFIEKSDFDRVLKEDVQRLSSEKLAFLKKYLPGASDLPLHMAELLLHCFQKKCVPKGRVILSENAAAKKCLYLVSTGSVFLSSSNLEMPIMPDVRTLGSLFRGGVFGSMEERPAQPCTVYVTSSCELFYASGRSLQALPSAMRKCVKQYLSATAEWRMHDGCQPRDDFNMSLSGVAQPPFRRMSEPQIGRGPAHLEARRASAPQAIQSGRSIFEVHTKSNSRRSFSVSKVRRNLSTGSLPSL